MIGGRSRRRCDRPATLTEPYRVERWQLPDCEHFAMPDPDGGRVLPCVAMARFKIRYQGLPAKKTAAQPQWGFIRVCPAHFAAALDQVEHDRLWTRRLHHVDLDEPAIIEIDISVSTRALDHGSSKCYVWTEREITGESVVLELIPDMHRSLRARTMEVVTLEAARRRRRRDSPRPKPAEVPDRQGELLRGDEL